MTCRRALALCACLLLSASLWQAGAGVYIHAKAALAQILIDDAWRRLRAGHKEAQPWPWADTRPVARLEFPRLKARMTVLAGVATLAFGPGHVDGSVLPGDVGISLIAGHRDTHFRLLERLAPGDVIHAEDRTGTAHRFRVTAKQVVDSRTTRLDPDGVQPGLILVTCYPFDAIVPGGPLRYLVFAEADPAPSRSGTGRRKSRAPASEGTIASGLGPSGSLSP